MRSSCVKVTLRQKPISKGRFSLYLDFYPEIRNPRTNKMTRREFLGMYIMASPATPVEKAFNEQMMERARAICCKRQLQVINAEFGFLDVDILNADFLEFFRETCRTKYQKWDIVYRHFEKFVGGKCKMGDINVDLCNKFRDYLLNANKLARLPHKGVSSISARLWLKILPEWLWRFCIIQDCLTFHRYRQNIYLCNTISSAPKK